MIAFGAVVTDQEDVRLNVDVELAEKLLDAGIGRPFRQKRSTAEVVQAAVTVVSAAASVVTLITSAGSLRDVIAMLLSGTTDDGTVRIVATADERSVELEVDGESTVEEIAAALHRFLESESNRSGS